MTNKATRTPASASGRPHEDAPDCPDCESGVFVSTARSYNNSSNDFRPKWKCHLCGRLFGSR